MQKRTQRRSLPASLSLAFAAFVTGLVLLAAPSLAAAQSDDGDASGQIRILEVNGLLDPVLHDFLIEQIDEAEADGVLGIMLQIDSAGSVIDDADFVELATRLRDTPLQTAAWVGPSGAAALGGTAELAGVADVLGVAVGARIGETGPPRLPATEFDAPFGSASARLETAAIGGAEAIELGLAPGSAGTEEELRRSLESNSVIRDFIRVFEGFQIATPDNEDPVGLGEAQFRQLPLSGQLFHTAASPELAYLFFVGGLMLLVFELFTAGVGVAGSIAAFCFVVGSYGLAVLPARPIAVALLVLAVIAFAVDIQTNIPRLYTAGGMVLFVIGTLSLYEGLRMSWITTGFGIIAAALYAYSGMPSMVRTRFSTPTIGRSWMIGELGEAVTELSPDGLVRIKDAPWRAMTNRATPVAPGDRVRVVGIERLVLEVEPEEGGAKDYRERH